MANSVDPTRTPAPITRANGASRVKGAKNEGPTSTIVDSATIESTTVAIPVDPRTRPAGRVPTSRMVAAIHTPRTATQQMTLAPSTKTSIAPEA